MNCQSCGLAIPVNATFCPHCGKGVYKSATPPTIMETPRNVMATHAGSDPMKVWWIVFGIVLFVTLFVPIDTTGTMFWDLFNVGGDSVGAGLIVNAVLGLTVFIIVLIFSVGIPRGATIAGCGLAGFITAMAMAGTGNVILMNFAIIGVSMTLSGCLLRQHNVNSLTARLVGGISGGVAAIFSVITVIKILTSLGNMEWQGVIAFVLLSLIFLLPVVAGILALVLIGTPQNTKGLLKACRTLIAIFIFSGIGWALLMPLFGLFQEFAAVEAVLYEAFRTFLQAVTLAIFLLMLGVGSAEMLKKIVRQG